ncbi:MAG: hypothetical protein MSIBF_03830 [Candidatus Altiarchaeales archaeon IMC4]|nr:MAG: hypothetical protein MSIBF_03830 [Candidatus Altiarchaeales archaeon IMC4]
MTSIELLSPAGNWDSLKAAVCEGADAVYFGLQGFNARRRADNFSDSDMENAVRYCHDRGVRAHLAANTLVKNRELGDYFAMIERAYSAGVDAVIVQELSFIPLIKENFPGMEVHASTQAGVFNSYYNRVLDGADRVVMPRELSLNQVKGFTEKTRIPAEIFVHGALCFGISGQCLMSGFLGGRSGNRGLCAQPCRKKYNGRFLMSTRDLCVVDRIPEIAGAGVRALKIEGRLRSPEYVGATTALYRRALDKGIDNDAFIDTQLAFSREYTRGALFKEYDVVSPCESGKRGIRLGTLGGEGEIKLDAELRVGDGVGVLTGRGTHGDVIRKIWFKGKSVDCGLAGQTVNLAVNAKEGDVLVLTSGAARRKAYRLKARENIIVGRTPKKALPLGIKPQGLSDVRLLVKAYSPEDAGAALDAGASMAYYNIFEKDFPQGSTGAYIPRCLTQWNAKKAIDLVESANPPSVLCADLGVASQLKGREVYLDISCNAFNDIDVAFYNDAGLIPVISPELSFREIYGFTDKRFAVYVHGRIPLVTTKYLLGEGSIKDEKNYTFPVRCELDYKQVLNSVQLGIYTDILQLRKNGITTYLIDASENTIETVSAYKRILGGENLKKPSGYTLGNYRSGVL